jgi:macrolide-specific efflux system membrane fusion protein
MLRRPITRWFLPLLILGLAGGAAYYWGRGYWSSSSVAVNQPVVIRPETRRMDATVSATGVVRLRVGAEVRVGARLSGIVKKLNVTVGAHINKDDIIAETDSRSLEAQLDQGRAQIKLDEVALRKAELDLARSRELLASGLTPRQQTEDLALAMESAQAKLEKSRRDLATVEVDLSYTKIRAPISGTVASVSTQEGETVAASFTAPTFVTIIEDNALELVAMVDETDIANIKPGNQVIFTTEAHPSREFAGVVKRIAPKATIVSGVVNYEVVINIRNSRDILKPDMTANISIKTSQREALVLPNVAIQREGDDRFVYIARDGKPEKRAVTVGLRDGGFTEIKKGVSPDDRIVSVNSPGGGKK